MASAAWPVYSPFAREHYGRGKDDGRVEAEADAVLSVLGARGFQVSEDVRTRVRRCTDTRRLEAWLRLAATAASVTELFE